MNEDAIANTTFAGNAIAAQPGKFAYLHLRLGAS